MPPPARIIDKRPAWVKISGQSLWIVCTKCKNQQPVCSGHIASTIPQSKVIAAGLAMGWKMAPVVLCKWCVMP